MTNPRFALDRAVGIDLGTTNSEIAWLPPSEREITMYRDRFQRRTVPSAVAWDAAAEKLVVGHAARSKRGKGQDPIESIKRKMGQATKVTVGPHELSPEEVSGKILRELKDRMTETLAQHAERGEGDFPVTRAVITVPAYFDAPQVEATRRAGELAGLEVLGLLHEPTAAAIFHAWKHRLQDGNYLVYDLGGGTFDVSVLRCVGGEYQVLAIDGDNYLGGDDFDRSFAEWLRKDLVKRGYTLSLDVRHVEEDRARFRKLVHLAQEIKESLSTSPVVQVSKQGILEDQAGELVSLEAEVGAADYESVIGDLVDVTIGCCERALARSTEVAGVTLADIDHVILVGGSTRVPLVQRRVTQALVDKSRAKSLLNDEVDVSVALGAALHAAQLGGTRMASPDGALSVHFSSSFASHKESARLALTLEAPASAELRSGDETLATLRKGERSRVDVPLPHNDGDTSDSLMLSVQTGTGEQAVTLPFQVYRTDARPKASALSRPSVVAKDIALEVVRAGRRERKVLLARGAGLPAESTHTLFTADTSGAVVLRILQNRLPIKVMMLELPPDTKVGTQVELTVTCDESMRMRARALVLGQEVWAQLETPKVAQSGERDIEALLQDAEAAERNLWGAFASVFRRERERLALGIREVVSTDPDKLAALCERMDLLIEDFRGRSEEDLVPPPAQFESTLNALRVVVYRNQSKRLGMSTEDWEKRIADLDTRAQTAKQTQDGPGWRRAFNELQALYETAHQEEFSSMKTDDPAYFSRRLSQTSGWARRLEEDLLEFVPAAAEELRSLQATEQHRLRKAMDEKVKAKLSSLGDPESESDRRAALRVLSDVDSELERIELGLQRIPQLGLVTDRGST